MEQKIWNYLKEVGFNDYGVAGLMGNLDAESGLRPNNLQDTYSIKFELTDEQYTQKVDNGTYTNFVKDEAGYGLAQWAYWTRKQNLLNYAKSSGRSIGNLEMQLEFLVKELREQYTNSVYKVLKTATSIQEASDAVLMNFERPYNAASHSSRRASMGQVYYNRFCNTSNNFTEGKDMQELTKGQNMTLTKNFVSKEFDCKGSGCCSTTLIDPKLVEYLQMIRDHFGKPITITSAYRCETHNRRVGGATGSRHSKGQAADIVVQGVSSREVAKYAESIGILGIGLYESSADGYFTHIDTRDYKSFWYGQSEQPRTTFGGTPTSPSVSTESKYSTYHKSSSKYNVQLLYLQKGDRGRDIQILQELLKIRGYDIETSGEFDEATKIAVKDFQKKTNQSQDGIVGAKTMEKLLTV